MPENNSDHHRYTDHCSSWGTASLYFLKTKGNIYTRKKISWICNNHKLNFCGWNHWCHAKELKCPCTATRLLSTSITRCNSKDIISHSKLTRDPISAHALSAISSFLFLIESPKLQRLPRSVAAMSSFLSNIVTEDNVDPQVKWKKKIDKGNWKLLMLHFTV